jgi:hypothetical protein
MPALKLCELDMSELGQLVISTLCQPLPVFPRKRTSSGTVGMSQTCQQRTHAAQQMAASFDRSTAPNDYDDGTFRSSIVAQHFRRLQRTAR